MTTTPDRPGVEAAIDHDGIEPAVYQRRWKILAVLCASLIIVIVGNTVLNVALPTLARPDGLGASNTELQWMVDAYALVFAGLLFTAGALGDRFGRKGALQAGLVVFAIGSLVGAFADSSGQVIAGRAVMGIGAAFIMPSTLSILTNVFPGRERAKAIAIWAGISGAGAAIGPVTSGLLLEHYWWGSVFLINLPIIAIALVAVWILVPKSKDSTASPLDPVGAVLSLVGISALVYAIIEGPNHGWASVESLLWFIGAIGVLALFAWWEWRSRHPMLDLRLFRNRRFSVASGGISLIFFAMFGMFYLLTQYLQFVLGYSPLEAALRLLPFPALMMIVAPQTPRLVARFGADRVASTGLAFIAVAFLLASQFDADHAVLVPRDRHLHPRLGDGAHDVADDDAADVRRASRPGRHRLGDERHDPRAGRRTRRGRARVHRHQPLHVRAGRRREPVCRRRSGTSPRAASAACVASSNRAPCPAR